MYIIQVYSNNKNNCWKIFNTNKCDKQLFQGYQIYPGDTVPSERVLSTAGNSITNKRNRLNPSTVKNVIFLKENLQKYFRRIVNKINF